MIDNPSGVGFSPLGSTAAPVKTEHEVGLQMVELLRQFSLLYPERAAAGIFVAGESYGGKYAAAAAAIDAYNAGVGRGTPTNLQGLVIADGGAIPGPTPRTTPR